MGRLVMPRSQVMHSQVRLGSMRAVKKAAKPDPDDSCPARAAAESFCSSARLARRRCGGHRNCSRSSSSRFPSRGASTVTTMALYPALSARRTMASVTSRFDRTLRG